jgi:hypothetical protein
MQNPMGWVLTNVAAMDWKAALFGYDAMACAIRFLQSAVFITVGFAFLIYPVEVCDGIGIPLSFDSMFLHPLSPSLFFLPCLPVGL